MRGQHTDDVEITGFIFHTESGFIFVGSKKMQVFFVSCAIMDEVKPANIPGITKPAFSLQLAPIVYEFSRK